MDESKKLHGVNVVFVNQSNQSITYSRRVKLKYPVDQN